MYQQRKDLANLLEKNCKNYEKRANIWQKWNIIKKKFKNSKLLANLREKSLLTKIVN